MVRSFTERVFGGVCGGLGARFGVNPWWFRALFVVLTLLSSGTFALLYVLLWWTLPQESLAIKKSGGFTLLVAVLLTALVIALWVGRDMGWLRGSSGQDLYFPALALLTSGVFFLRQVNLR